MRTKWVSFDVEATCDSYIFVSLNIENIEALAKEAFNFFFSNENLLNYFQAWEYSFIFNPTDINYASLFRDLSYFFNDNAKPTSNEKAGKIGEYYLSILLLSYFKYDCIFPKISVVTDDGMPVYGIDTLFYSPVQESLLFGEAKFTSDLSSGISLINKSLESYENQMNDEFRFINANRAFARSKNSKLREYANVAEKCITFKDFINDVGFSHIEIPLFVAHGNETNSETIIQKLKSIKLFPKLLELPVKYLIISLPVVDKEKYLEVIKKLLREKSKEYENKVSR